ncbi:MULTISPECIES: SDR family NAD(P)-dependent oxidoreductase [unclassified Nocardioides]|uniref:SDR family NAD(P)-dependent oxidoreductase n=1 Tax=unclassified Nocardioides TaxID=2615069 RepID=UPI003619D387
MTDRVVLVTGAAGGIGAAAARDLAAEGLSVFAADIDAPALDVVADDVSRRGGRMEAVGLDVRDTESVARCFDQVARRAGRLDALVCGAGIFPRVPFDATTADVLDRVMDVNFRGSVLCVLAAVPLMRDGGSIVLLTSGAGDLEAAAHPFQRGFSLYGASKAALDRWALGVAEELRDRHITVVTLCPGAMVRTGGIERLGLAEPVLRGAVSPEAITPAILELVMEFGRGGTARRLRASEHGVAW